MTSPAPSWTTRALGRIPVLFVLFVLPAASPWVLAGPKALGLRHVALDLPGAPAEILHADLDGDGRQDLAVVIARTQWGEIGTDRIEGMMQISEVVPALFDRREVRAYRLGEDGAYTQAGEPLALPSSVISLEAGPPGLPIAVLTDDGVSALRLASTPDAAGAEASPARPALVLTPWIADRPVLAGSKTLVPRLGMVRDLDGDATADLLLPARDGLAVYTTSGGMLATHAASRVPLPGDLRRSGTAPSRRYPRPGIGDLDGDGKPDLIVTHSDMKRVVVDVLRGEGGGRFAAPQRIALERFLEAPAKAATGAPAATATPAAPAATVGEAGGDAALTYFGDLDGDGLAEAVFSSAINTGKSGLKEAKEPEFLYRFHHVGKDLVVRPEPYQELRVLGFGFKLDAGGVPTAEFQDLDGDGRKDLVTVTLDFSLFQIIRVMTTKRIGIGLDFHVWHQGSDGRFAPVTGLDLSETLRMDLNNLKLGSLAQFAGDFDGDGRADFVHLGRGKDVTIHRGQAGCRYASKADLTVPLEEEPADVSLVRIGDFDGDGRDDLGVIRPLDPGDSGDPDISSPVRLDLYLSGGVR